VLKRFRLALLKLSYKMSKNSELSNLGFQQRGFS